MSVAPLRPARRIAGAGGLIFTSLDGLSWTTQDSGTQAVLYGVAGNSSTIVAAGAAEGTQPGCTVLVSTCSESQ